MNVPFPSRRCNAALRADQLHFKRKAEGLLFLRGSTCFVLPLSHWSIPKYRSRPGMASNRRMVECHPDRHCLILNHSCRPTPLIYDRPINGPTRTDLEQPAPGRERLTMDLDNIPLGAWISTLDAVAVERRAPWASKQRRVRRIWLYRLRRPQH